MNKPTATFRIKDTDIKEILSLRDSGYQVICPRCKAPLLIATNKKEADEVGLNSLGIYCSKNTNHVGIYFENRRRIWDKIDAMVRENERKNK